MVKIKEMLDGKKWPLSEEEMLEPVIVTKGIEECLLSGGTSKRLY